MLKKSKWIFGMLSALAVSSLVSGCSAVDLGHGIIREVKDYKDNICQEIKEIKDGFLEEVHDWMKEDESD